MQLDVEKTQTDIAETQKTLELRDLATAMSLFRGSVNLGPSAVARAITDQQLRVDLENLASIRLRIIHRVRELAQMSPDQSRTVTGNELESSAALSCSRVGT